MRYPFIAVALAAAVGAVGAESPVGAAVVVRSYVLAAAFSSGPVPFLTQNFTLTFDPTVSSRNNNPTNYSTSTSNPTFNQPVLFDVKRQTQDSVGTEINVGGAVGGADVVFAGFGDFVSTFYVDEAGNPIPYRPNNQPLVFYNTLGSFNYYVSSATVVTVDPIASVPEAATWAMMILGMGAVGFAMRRRRAVKTNVSYA